MKNQFSGWIERNKKSISIFVWGSSFVAVILSLTTAYGIGSSANLNPSSINEKAFSIFVLIYPWIVLFKMNQAWLSNIKLRPFWPISGTLIACLAVFFSRMGALIVAPLGIIFACYLVKFHLISKNNQKPNA